MNLKKRWISILALILVLVAVILVGASIINTGDGETIISRNKKDTITLWYTDEALTDYLLSKAVDFNESHDDVRIEMELVSGLEYLENINKASISDDETTPDLFIVTNDSLEKAYLAGLASEITDTSLMDESGIFSDTAKNAVTYNGKYVGYPFSFETAALLYNKTYLDNIASEAEITDSSSLVPESILDILTFADLYSAPENVEYFLKWDVSDIFYNYFFIGNYITVGGESGDNEEEINIYSTESIASMMVYQELNQFFSIDADDTNYDSIMQEFIDGKIIYTIATSDCIATLEENDFAYEYGVASLPSINSDLLTKGMSVTNALVVNGYSLHKDEANEFISYLYSQDTDSQLYALSGKMPAWKQTTYTNEACEQFYNNYLVSTPIPKMVKTSNFWIELEACFARVWSGEDANTEMKTISEQIKSQISGEAYTEEQLQSPEVEILEVEESVEE